LKKKILSITIAGIWITVSEFVRNESLLKTYWISYYNSIGLKFETLPINGILWFIWGIIFAYLIMKLYEKFSFGETIFLSWISGFVMMWITIYNLQVLPLDILLYAIPLSLVEIFVAVIIIKKLLD